MTTAHSWPLPTTNNSKAPYKMLYFGWQNSCMTQRGMHGNHGYKNYKYKWCSMCVLCVSIICICVCVRVHKYVCMRMCNVICHPSPSNSQHEHTICMNYYTLIAWLLLTPDHYQQWITVKLHIKCCTLDDKIVAQPREECMATMHSSLGHATITYKLCVHADCC